MDRTGIEIACVFTMMGFYEDCTKHNDLLGAERVHAEKSESTDSLYHSRSQKLGQAAVDELNRCIAAEGVSRDQISPPGSRRLTPSMVKATFVE